MENNNILDTQNVNETAGTKEVPEAAAEKQTAVLSEVTFLYRPLDVTKKNLGGAKARFNRATVSLRKNTVKLEKTMAKRLAKDSKKKPLLPSLVLTVRNNRAILINHAVRMLAAIIPMAEEAENAAQDKNLTALKEKLIRELDADVGAYNEATALFNDRFAKSALLSRVEQDLIDFSDADALYLPLEEYGAEADAAEVFTVDEAEEEIDLEDLVEAIGEAEEEAEALRLSVKKEKKDIRNKNSISVATRTCTARKKVCDALFAVLVNAKRCADPADFKLAAAKMKKALPAYNKQLTAVAEMTGTVNQELVPTDLVKRIRDGRPFSMIPDYAANARPDVESATSAQTAVNDALLERARRYVPEGCVRDVDGEVKPVEEQNANFYALMSVLEKQGQKVARLVEILKHAKGVRNTEDRNAIILSLGAAVIDYNFTVEKLNLYDHGRFDYLPKILGAAALRGDLEIPLVNVKNPTVGYTAEEFLRLTLCELEEAAPEETAENEAAAPEVTTEPEPVPEEAEIDSEKEYLAFVTAKKKEIAELDASDRAILKAAKAGTYDDTMKAVFDRRNLQIDIIYCYVELYRAAAEHQKKKDCKYAEKKLSHHLQQYAALTKAANTYCTISFKGVPATFMKDLKNGIEPPALEHINYVPGEYDTTVQNALSPEAEARLADAGKNKDGALYIDENTPKLNEYRKELAALKAASVRGDTQNLYRQLDLQQKIVQISLDRIAAQSASAK